MTSSNRLNEDNNDNIYKERVKNDKNQEIDVFAKENSSYKRPEILSEEESFYSSNSSISSERNRRKTNRRSAASDSDSQSNDEDDTEEELEINKPLKRINKNKKNKYLNKKMIDDNKIDNLSKSSDNHFSKKIKKPKPVVRNKFKDSERITPSDEKIKNIWYRAKSGPMYRRKDSKQEIINMNDNISNKIDYVNIDFNKTSDFKNKESLSEITHSLQNINMDDLEIERNSDQIEIKNEKSKLDNNAVLFKKAKLYKDGLKKRNPSRRTSIIIKKAISSKEKNSEDKDIMEPTESLKNNEKKVVEKKKQKKTKQQVLRTKNIDSKIELGKRDKSVNKSKKNEKAEKLPSNDTSTNATLSLRKKTKFIPYSKRVYRKKSEIQLKSTGNDGVQKVEDFSAISDNKNISSEKLNDDTNAIKSQKNELNTKTKLVFKENNEYIPKLPPNRNELIKQSELSHMAIPVSYPAILPNSTISSTDVIYDNFVETAPLYTNLEPDYPYNHANYDNINEVEYSFNNPYCMDYPTFQNDYNSSKINDTYSNMNTYDLYQDEGTYLRNVTHKIFNHSYGYSNINNNDNNNKYNFQNNLMINNNNVLTDSSKPNMDSNHVDDNQYKLKHSMIPIQKSTAYLNPSSRPFVYPHRTN